MPEPITNTNKTYTVSFGTPGRIVAFKKGEMILHPADNPKYVYIVKSGLVKVYSVDARHDENINVFDGPGDMFPITWMIGEKRQNIYFKAYTDCRIELIPRDSFLQSIKHDPELCLEAMQKVLRQFSLYATRVNNLEFKYARERLAYRLLLLANRFGKKKGELILLPYFTQQDLGATINMTRESVSREMSRLERLGMVEYDSSNIIIKDTEALRRELGTKVPVVYIDPV